MGATLTHDPQNVHNDSHRRQTTATRHGLAVCVTVCAVTVLAATLPTLAEADAAESAIARCHRVELLDVAERPAAIALALALAENAIESAPNDARSHYAVFCGLAKRVRHSGVGLSVLSDLRRMRKQIDLALALDPGYAEATAAKGAFLYYLPRLLGGSVRSGLELLERSIELDPTNAATRLIFSDLLADRGEHHASERESKLAVELLRADGNEDHRAAACAVADICADNRWSKEERLAISGAC